MSCDRAVVIADERLTDEDIVWYITSHGTDNGVVWAGEGPQPDEYDWENTTEEQWRRDWKVIERPEHVKDWRAFERIVDGGITQEQYDSVGAKYPEYRTDETQEEAWRNELWDLRRAAPEPLPRHDLYDMDEGHYHNFETGEERGRHLLEPGLHEAFYADTDDEHPVPVITEAMIARVKDAIADVWYEGDEAFFRKHLGKRAFLCAF